MNIAKKFKLSLAFSLCLLNSTVGQTISSSFDTDLEGWIVEGDVTSFTHFVGDGNPAPMMLVDEQNASGPIFRAVAPAQFLGDLTLYDEGTISIDARLVFTGGQVVEQFGITSIFGAGDVATLDIAMAQISDDWQTFAATLSAANWGKSQAEWETILSDVTSIEIVIESVGGNETIGFDNPTIARKIIIGDINCDGQIDLLDVAPFVDLLGNGSFEPKADINQDGVVNLLDVGPFVDLLSG